MKHYNNPLNNYKHLLNSITYNFGVVASDIISEENLNILHKQFKKKELVTLTLVEQYLHPGLTWEILKTKFDNWQFNNLKNHILQNKNEVKKDILSIIYNQITVNDILKYEYYIKYLLENRMDVIINDMTKQIHNREYLDYLNGLFEHIKTLIRFDVEQTLSTLHFAYHTLKNEVELRSNTVDPSLN